MRLLSLYSVIALLMVSTIPLYAAPQSTISVVDLSHIIEDERVQVDCEVQYRVGKKVREALSNGIEMTFVLEIELRQQNKLWLDLTLGKYEHEFKVKYHALSKQYVMVQKGNNLERSFPDLYSAFYYQRQLHNAEILGAPDTQIDSQYYIRARARLVSEKLPLPLRIKSYISSEWRPSSGWTKWPI